jgi:uncharacterized MAPEG superfamily protein
MKFQNYFREVSDLSNALIITLVGVILFLTIVVVILSILLFSKASAKKQTGNRSKRVDYQIVTKIAPNANAVSTNESELIAVIAAAVAAVMNTSTSGIHVKSIKRIGHTVPVWNVASRY